MSAARRLGDELGRRMSAVSFGLLRGKPAVESPAPTILVVDDEEPLRLLMSKVLQRHGYEVLTATDGEQALQICAERNGAIHLLVTDLTMPQMGGEELIGRVATRWPAMPTLVVSGYANHHYFRDRKKRSAYLSKPFTSEELAAKVAGILSPEGVKAS